MFEKFIAALGPKQKEEITQVVNLYDAVLAHNAWKKRLFEYLEGQSREELNPAKIGVDHQCVLGKWIHTDGIAKFGKMPEFIKLVEEHARFHAHAASVVEAHLSGKTQMAMEILTGSFEEQSRKTVKYLTKLNALIEGHQQPR
jgi:hypothetical protein